MASKGGYSKNPAPPVDIEKLNTFCEQVFSKFLIEICKYDRIQKDVANSILMKCIYAVQKKLRITGGKTEHREWYQLAVMRGENAECGPFEAVTVYNNNRSSSGVLTVTIALDGSLQYKFTPIIIDGKLVIPSESLRGSQGDFEDTLPPNLAEPFSCKYDCAMCPNEHVKFGAPKTMTRSYLSSEAVHMAGNMEHFIIIWQIMRRLALLEWQGHIVDKIEMILLGGTWDSFDLEYRDYVINCIYYGCNMFQHLSFRQRGVLFPKVFEWRKVHNSTSIGEFIPFADLVAIRPMADLDTEMMINKNGFMGRIISIVLETRPDQLLNIKNIMRLRHYGCTRVQIGVQQIKQEILDCINRMHSVDDTRYAIRNLLNAGFKVDIHLMTDLPGSTDEDDRKMFYVVCFGEDFQADQLKYYSCMDIKYTAIRRWKERTMKMIAEGRRDEVDNIAFLMNAGDKIPDQVKVWLPRSEVAFDQLFATTMYALEIVRPWMRVNRVVRDFPKASINNNGIGFESENLCLDLRDKCEKMAKKTNQNCFDIRSREVAGNPPIGFEDSIEFMIRSYPASDGMEYFISAEVPAQNPRHANDSTLFGLIRLRIPNDDAVINQKSKGKIVVLPIISDERTAIIREIHVYGNLVMNVDASKTAVQHMGIGSALLKAAEYIAHSRECQKIIVISGVGVMGYYEKRGYSVSSRELGSYMVKKPIINSLAPIRLLNKVYSYEDLINISSTSRQN